MQTKRQRIRDPLHNLIEFGSDPFEQILWRVVQTPSFQRLRRIKQLGFSEYVFPGATHTRFSHSLGTYHIAKNLLGVIRERSKKEHFEFDETLARQAIAAALVHDVGHGPFSHAFEDVGKKLNLKMAKHEDVSDEIIRNGDVGKALDADGHGLSAKVADLIRAPGPAKIYGAVVSSQFDADRLDYMQRDRLMTGTQLAHIDLAWLTANLEIDEVPWGYEEQQLGKRETFILGTKSIHAAEAYILGLFQLYPTVYCHKATRGAEKLFTELLLRIFFLLQDNTKNFVKTNLPENHPLIIFAKNSELSENVLRLDDAVITGSLALMGDASDPLIQNFSRRLRERKLYKCINVWEQLWQNKAGLQNSLVDMKKRQKAVEKTQVAVAQVSEKIQEWAAANQDNDSPTRILIDEGEREPYKRIQDEKGPLNQIMIKTTSGKTIDINKQSDIVKAIPIFKFFRVYTAGEDSEAKGFIEKAIKEVKNGKKF